MLKGLWAIARAINYPARNSHNGAIGWHLSEYD
jgi:hypothetical protein